MAGALAILAPLARAYPRAALTQYELGLALTALGQEEAGLQALRQAVALNGELPEAWRALGERLFAAGDLAGAEQAFAEHARAAVRVPPRPRGGRHIRRTVRGRGTPVASACRPASR